MSPNHLEELYSLGISNIKLGLRNIENILSRLKNPQNHPRIIHFAGTNGKGSTLIVVEALLLASGFSVGSTISPHLIHFNERFRIDGVPIDDDNLNTAFNRVCEACGIDPANFAESAKKSAVRPTFFEFSIAMAFLIFAWRKVDYILLETGLGGRLDATNVITSPLACVITRIDYDHQEYLGDSLEEITLEKLGIVKKEGAVYVAHQKKVVEKLIRDNLSGRSPGPVAAPGCFGFHLKNDLKEFYFKKAPLGADKTLAVKRIGLNGVHQLENISTALAVYWSLIKSDRQISLEQIVKLLESLQWEARLQYLDTGRSLLLDGAHNRSGIISLVRYLSINHKSQKILLAINWVKSRSYKSVFKELENLNIDFQPLRMDREQTDDKDRIYQTLLSSNLVVKRTKDISNFIDNYLPEYQKTYDLIVVTGSLYLVGDFLSHWNSRHSSESQKNSIPAT